MASKAGYGPLAVLVAVNVLNFYDRHVLGALTEPIRKDFGLTDSQVGLIGSAFIWTQNDRSRSYDLNADTFRILDVKSGIDVLFRSNSTLF